MKGTYLEIRLGKIAENAAAVKELCGKRQIEVLGVTKGCSAIPEVASAFMEGGIHKLADARLENIRMLRERGFTNSMTLLRLPMPSRAGQVVRYADCSLNSEFRTIKALSDAAAAEGKLHQVILMLELGDLREGMYPQDALRLMEESKKLPGIFVTGIGANVGCYGGVLPTKRNLTFLCEVAKALEQNSGRTVPVISGGATSSLSLIESGEMPERVNQVRVGEGILLGTDTSRSRKIPWLHQDAFLLHAEVVEVRSKPSIPLGMTGQDAFGQMPSFEDLGIRKRAIVAMGRQDVPPEGIIPEDPGVRVLGGSSDHILLDIEEAKNRYRVGDMMSFGLRYQGLLHACSSPYIRRVMLPA